MDRDRHMNVFEEYTHGEKMPLENSLTRALAISLDESGVFMRHFIQMLSERANDPSLKVGKNYNVNIQFDLDRINEIEGIKKIYGFTLTTESYDFDEESSEEQNKKEITDLIISFDHTLIVIEAKKNATNANKQLEGQINKALGNLNKKNIKVKYTGIEWEDIFKVIRVFYSSLTEVWRQNRIIKDFRDFIYKYLGECGKPEKLSKIEKVEKFDNIFEAQVNNRINDIKLEYIEKFSVNGDIGLVKKRESIEVNLPYVGECALKYDYDNQVIFTEMYIGSTCGQYNEFKSSKLSEYILNLEELEFESQKYSVEIIPYLKFANAFSRTITHYRIKRKEIDQYGDIVGKYTKNNRGEWVKKDKRLFDNIKSIFGKNFIDYKRIDSFIKAFKEQVESYVQKEVVCTVEYCLMVKIPFKDSVKLDDDNKIPDLINAVIEMVSPQ